MLEDNVNHEPIQKMALLVKFSSNEAIVAIIEPSVVPAGNVKTLNKVKKPVSETYRVQYLYPPERLTTRSSTSISQEGHFVHPQRLSVDVSSDQDA